MKSNFQPYFTKNHYNFHSKTLEINTASIKYLHTVVYGRGRFERKS